MNVLLLSQNHTIAEMFSLAYRDMDTVELTVVSDAGKIRGRDYGLMFVDNTFPRYGESIALAQELGHPATIVLGHAATLADSRFDGQLAKPFLPSEIREITIPYLRKEKEESVESPADLPAEKPQRNPKKQAAKKKKKHRKEKDRKMPAYRAETEVLNLDEIETIKALLEEDGLEIVHEEELAEKVLQEREAAAGGDQQAALIDALRTMRPRKIRKLLKGATVRIEITFPKDRS